MLDYFGGEEVEIHIDHTGTKIWININGTCELRAYKVKQLTLIDDRKVNEQSNTPGKGHISECDPVST